MRTFEEIRELLAKQFHKEKLRLKSYGTRADSFQLANVVARYVEALMAESRYRELKKLSQVIYNDSKHLKHARKLLGHVSERMNATKAMSKAIQHMAEDNEKKRPWKRKEKKKYHKHKHSKRNKK